MTPFPGSEAAKIPLNIQPSRHFAIPSNMRRAAILCFLHRRDEANTSKKGMRRDVTHHGARHLSVVDVTNPGAILKRSLKARFALAQA